MKHKLYKDRQNKKLCGVCAGIAEYFNIDPSIVRILFFIGAWFYGIFLILYIACAVVLPNKDNDLLY
ncbi:PspC domain-containing protein [Clostridium sp. BJN0001]|uniref:PspC domain-containing protein n=1 Tax=Clostridium sp. BJN0001 TaxID=2930219 RepID=UPI001FD020CF|nr:PspC domain-containing protein [Clostridium sp. BJN0001]